MFNLSKIGYKIFKDLQEDRLNPLDAAVSGHVAGKIDKAYESMGFPDQNLSTQQLDEYKNEVVRSRLFGTPMHMPKPIFGLTDKPIEGNASAGITHKVQFGAENEAQEQLMDMFNVPTEAPTQVIVSTFNNPPLGQAGAFIHEKSHADENIVDVENEELYPMDPDYRLDRRIQDYLGKGTEIRARLKELEYYNEANKKAIEESGATNPEIDEYILSRILELRPFIDSYKARNPDLNTTLYDELSNKAVEKFRQSFIYGE